MAVPGVDETLPGAVAALDGLEAAAAADAVAVTILDQRGGEPGVFAAVGGLRGATELLRSALELESGADARDGAAEGRAMAAAEVLTAAVSQAVGALAALPLPAPDRQALAGRLQEGLRSWQDPFAADSTGAQELAALGQVVADAPEGAAGVLSVVHDAVVRMAAAGPARDQAERDRRAAILARTQAESRWRGAVGALAALAGPGPWWEPARPLVALAHARRVAAEESEDDWFC